MNLRIASGFARPRIHSRILDIHFSRNNIADLREIHQVSREMPAACSCLMNSRTGRYQRWQADISAAITTRIGMCAKNLKLCNTGETCPDIFRLNNGDYLVIGTNVTGAYEYHLPSGDGRADYEDIVMIPSAILESAAMQLVTDADRKNRSTYSAG